jgi:hypothetical protein
MRGSTLQPIENRFGDLPDSDGAPRYLDGAICPAA